MTFMINTFSAIMMIITGISGICWILKFLFVIVYRNYWYKKEFFQSFKNYCLSLNHVYVSCIKLCMNTYEFISSMFLILLIIFLIRSFVIEPFQIPSGSMMPTLLIGDFILVNKFVYGVKDPIYQKTLIHYRCPQRGDLVVFKYPNNPKLNYIKRIIGEPRDKVVYNTISKQLKIFPIDSNGEYKKSLPVVYNNIILSDYFQTFHRSKDGSVNTAFVKIKLNQQQPTNGVRLFKTTESLNGVEHDILTMISPNDNRLVWSYDQYSQHLISEWLVPDNEYFVMGDNRDSSSDSRYWGFVPEQNIIGKAIMIWMSVNQGEGKWPVGITLCRLGFIQ